MSRFIAASTLVFVFCAIPAYSQEKPKRVKPDINESKEFPNVFHSPSADSTPTVFRSILQMEIIVKKAESEAEVIYANGTVVSSDGLLVSVVSEPGANENEAGGIESAAVLMLDGRSAAAELVSFEPKYGVAIFRVTGLDLRPLTLSKAPLVANRRIHWHAVFKNGRKTYLYTRPLRVHQATHQKAETTDLCEIIDTGSSSLNADRSGSALVALDGTLIGVMGRLEHWNVTPKNDPPRRKLAWAVPAHVIARLLEESAD